MNEWCIWNTSHLFITNICMQDIDVFQTQINVYDQYLCVYDIEVFQT